ncbi:hypothetical protein LQ356_02850 [Metamycoplasma faucium]|uniref:Uncharacterized protein n=1 Tax=Metamycoplasma faucium TaxID=56142 RepID=A0ABZ2TKZ5_9BACT
MENNNQINTLNVYDNNQKIYKNAKRSFFVMLGQIIAISSFIFIFLVSFLAIVYTAIRGSYNSDIYALLVSGWFILLYVVFLLTFLTLGILTIVFNILLYISGNNDQENSTLFLLVLIGTFVLQLMAFVCAIILMNKYKKMVASQTK